MAATKSPRLWYCLVSGLLIASQLPHASAASKECFDQNGNQLSSDQALPCNEDLVRDGPCCAPGTICLSNGLCKNADALVNRFTDTFKPFCTDGTWTTSNCFDGCNSVDGYGMKQCGDNRFCCFSDNATACDCDGTSLFELDAATFVTTLPLSTMFSTATSLPTSASATETSSSSSESSPAQPSNHSVAIGAGIGAGVGVPLLAAVGVLAWYLRRRQKSRDTTLGAEETHPMQEMKGLANVRYKPMGSVTELSGERRYEMDAIKELQEIDGHPKNQRGA